MGAVVAGCALVELANVNGVLESAVLDQGALGDVLVVLGQAHDEAQVDLGVRVELAGAQLNNVAHAFGWAVHALDAVVAGGTVCRVVRWVFMSWRVIFLMSLAGSNLRADICELKVYLFMDDLHSGEDELPQGVLWFCKRQGRFHGVNVQGEAYSCVGAFADNVRLEWDEAVGASRWRR